MPEIIETLSNFGFPIVCCGLLYMTMISLIKQHKEETDKMTIAINNNTKLLERILEFLHKE